MAMNLSSFGQGLREGQDFARQMEKDMQSRAKHMMSMSDAMQRQQDAADDRQAAHYLSSLSKNRQLAAANGIKPQEFFQSQLQQMEADDAFQGMSPMVRSKIRQQLTDSALVTAQNLHNLGQVTDANALTQTFGLSPLANEIRKAGLEGGMPEMVEAINRQFGVDLQPDEQGMVNLYGMDVPFAEAVQGIYKSNSLLGGLQAALGHRDKMVLTAEQEKLAGVQDDIRAQSKRTNDIALAIQMHQAGVPFANIHQMLGDNVKPLEGYLGAATPTGQPPAVEAETWAGADAQQSGIMLQGPPGSATPVSLSEELAAATQPPLNPAVASPAQPLSSAIQRAATPMRDDSLDAVQSIMHRRAEETPEMYVASLPTTTQARVQAVLQQFNDGRMSQDMLKKRLELEGVDVNRILKSY